MRSCSTGFRSSTTPQLVLLLVDPFTFPADMAVVDQLNDEHPGIPVVGGIATGAGRPGAQALILDGEIYRRGAVGVGARGRGRSRPSSRRVARRSAPTR